MSSQPAATCEPSTKFEDYVSEPQERHRQGPARVAQEKPAREGSVQDGVTAYLREIQRFALLSHRQQLELARQIEAGEEGATERFVVANLRLVVAIAKQFQDRGLPLLDLIQEGNIGLMYAAQRFDWRLGYHFSSYATWWIRQSIARALAERGRTIRLPLLVHQTMGRIRQASERLTQELGREPMQKELANEAGISVQELERITQAWVPPLSLETPVGDEGTDTLSDVLPDTNAEPPEEPLLESTVREETNTAIQETLSEREHLVLRMRFGLADGETHSLENIGEQLGLHRERIRQIELGALHKLRSSVAVERLRGSR